MQIPREAAKIANKMNRVITGKGKGGTQPFRYWCLALWNSSTGCYWTNLSHHLIRIFARRITGLGQKAGHYTNPCSSSRAWGFASSLMCIFVDFRTAFDLMSRKALSLVPKAYNVLELLVSTIIAMYQEDSGHSCDMESLRIVDFVVAFTTSVVIKVFRRHTSPSSDI